MGIKERERRVEVFFYGLFMDEELLRGKGLEPDSCAVVSSASGRKTGRSQPVGATPSDMNSFSKGGVYGTRKTGQAFHRAADRHVAPLEVGRVVA